MLPKEPRPLNVNDPRALGISTEDLDRFFEHRKHDRTASQGVRASTQSLKESARDLQLPSVSNLDAAGLERELLQARQRGDLPRIIATLQAKVKLRQLGRAERKKVLIDLLLELLNARKIASIEECLKQYEPVVAGTEDDQSEYFSLCFELLSIVSKIEKKSRWVAFFEYQRKGQSVAHLLARKQAKDEESAQRGDYFETGVDYLKRVVQTIELEFKIKQEGRGSASYLFGYGEGPIGIGRESKHHSGVGSRDAAVQRTDRDRLADEPQDPAAGLRREPHGRSRARPRPARGQAARRPLRRVPVRRRGLGRQHLRAGLRQQRARALRAARRAARTLRKAHSGCQLRAHQKRRGRGGRPGLRVGWQRVGLRDPPGAYPARCRGAAPRRGLPGGQGRGKGVLLGRVGLQEQDRGERANPDSHFGRAQGQAALRGPRPRARDRPGRPGTRP